jgi:hypothetical protein
VTGEFVDGTVSLDSQEPGCGRQLYDIADAAIEVVKAGAEGEAEFQGTLTHYRTRIFGHCITDFATVQGTVVFTFP